MNNHSDKTQSELDELLNRQQALRGELRAELRSSINTTSVEQAKRIRQIHREMIFIDGRIKQLEAGE